MPCATALVHAVNACKTFDRPGVVAHTSGDLIATLHASAADALVAVDKKRLALADRHSKHLAAESCAKHAGLESVAFRRSARHA